MSSNRIETTTDEGFTRRVDAESARRQFNMSLGMLVVLAVGTLSAAMTLRIEPTPVENAPARLIVQAPQLVHVQQAAQTVRTQPGG